MIKKILKENYLNLIILLLIIIVFSIIMRSPLHDQIIEFDYKVMSMVNKVVNNKLTIFFRIITNFGDIYIPIVILVCILIFLKNKWIFILQTSSYAFAGLVTLIAKLMAARPRPIDALIDIPRSYSFPSGHTLTSVVFYVTLIYLLTYKSMRRKRQKLMLLMFAFALLIAVSRVYLGVHYFSDIIGGFIIAFPCMLIIMNVISKNFKSKL